MELTDVVAGRANDVVCTNRLILSDDHNTCGVANDPSSIAYMLSLTELALSNVAKCPATLAVGFNMTDAPSTCESITLPSADNDAKLPAFVGTTGCGNKLVNDTLPSITCPEASKTGTFPANDRGTVSILPANCVAVLEDDCNVVVLTTLSLMANPLSCTVPVELNVVTLPAALGTTNG
jgi:hypothetical protein